MLTMGRNVMRSSERRGKNCRRCREISVFSGIIIMVFCWWVPSAALTFNSFQMTAPWARVYVIWCRKERGGSRKMATTWILPVSFEMKVYKGVKWHGPVPSLVISSRLCCPVQGVHGWLLFVNDEWSAVLVTEWWCVYPGTQGDETTYSSFLLRAPLPALDLCSPQVIVVVCNLVIMGVV